MNGKNKIDDTDMRIIQLLQGDGRLSNTSIAKKLGISEATVRKRLNRLIEEEFIQVVAVTNPFKLGFEAVGVLKISTDIKKIDEVVEELKKIKPVWFVVQTTGESDIHAEFIAPSIEALNNLINEQIYKIDGVLSAETSLILNFLKRDYNWGIAKNDD